MSYRIDPEAADFIRSGLSITLAAASPACVPSLSRALAAEVVGEDELRVFLIANTAQAVLRDLECSWRVAIVFSRPSTHRTLQIKGRLVGIDPVDEAWLETVHRQMEAFSADLRLIGHAPGFASTLLGFERRGLRCLRVRAETGFQQTPGPGAGRPLGAAS